MEGQIEVEAPYASNNLQSEQNKNNMSEKTFSRRWLIVAMVVAIASFGVVSFGSGFAVGYFAVLGEGKCLFRFH